MTNMRNQLLVRECLTAITAVLCAVVFSVSCGTIPFSRSSVWQAGADGATKATKDRVVLPFGLETSVMEDPLARFAASTRGGIAGTLLRVTTLAADGPGSLRTALAADGPRLIVFDVGGVIDLGGHSLAVRNPYVTIAGQTAPDPGITLTRGELSIETHDAVVQHIAVRPGDRGPADSNREWTPDGMGVHRGAARPAHDVVFDHCSATWAVDENLSVSGPADLDTSRNPDLTSHNVTLRHCLIAEGLSHATHPKGEHSKGTLIHDGVRNVAIGGCLYANNRERNPRLKGGTTSVVAGNVMYNWGSACVGIGSHGNRRTLAGAETVVVGNVAIAGADTRRAVLVHGLDPGGRAFVRNNAIVDAAGAALPLVDANVVQLATLPPWAPEVVTAEGPWAIAADTLRRAGSRPARRDPIDARIVQSVILGTGRIIDTQDSVGGYPVSPMTRRSLEVPESVEARRRWLDELSAELGEDKTLDLEPLWKRLGVKDK
jgi:hypothetical protein